MVLCNTSYFVLSYVLTETLFKLITQVVVLYKIIPKRWFQLILIKICSWMITGNHMNGFWSNRDDKILSNNKIAFPWRNRNIFYHRDDSSWNIQNACVIITGNLSCLHRHLNKPSPDMCSDKSWAGTIRHIQLHYTILYIISLFII